MFLNPDDTVKRLLIREDWHIADLGAGSGAYTLSAAKYVPVGKVYAVDINRDLLSFIKAKALAFGHQNTEVIWGDIDRAGGTHIKDASMDAVILANTFFQIANKDIAAEEIKRILKPGGKVLFIDWAGSFGGVGPREEDVVSSDTAENIFKKFGFVLKEHIPAGDYHYGMIFTIPSQP